MESCGGIAAPLAARGLRATRILIDPSVVRGLEYYTGPVFEAELTFMAEDDDGRPVRFARSAAAAATTGSSAAFAASRSRDRLFDRRLAPARCVARHQEPDRRRGRDPRPGGRACARPRRGSMPNYQRFVARLRDAKIASELYLGSAA